MSDQPNVPDTISDCPHCQAYHTAHAACVPATANEAKLDAAINHRRPRVSDDIKTIRESEWSRVMRAVEAVERQNKLHPIATEDRPCLICGTMITAADADDGTEGDEPAPPAKPKRQPTEFERLRDAYLAASLTARVAFDAWHQEQMGAGQ